MRENDFKSYLEKIVEETTFLEMKNGVGTADRCNVDGAEEGVGDPVAVQTKGTGRAQEPFGCRGKKILYPTVNHRAMPHEEFDPNFRVVRKWPAMKTKAREVARPCVSLQPR
ncbi:hypothetical protein S83_016908 [Arachis hypogaea]